MLIISPVTDFAVLSVFAMVGWFNFRQVRQFIIEISEPESSWNFMELLKISTVTYFLKFLLTVSSDWACLILLLGFLIMLAYQHWVKSWPFLLQFLLYLSSWLNRISSNAIYHNGNMVQAVLFIARFKTWDLPFVFLRGIGGWLASDFFLSEPHLIPRSFLSHTWQKLLFDSPLPIFGESILVHAWSVPVVWLRHLLLCKY